MSVIDSNLEFDKGAGIYYYNTDCQINSSVLSALFVDKSDACFQFLLKQGCDVTGTDADRSYSDTADGSRWYLSALLHGVKVCLLLDSGAEVSVISRGVYKRFSCRVDKSLVGVRPVKTATGDKM